MDKYFLVWYTGPRMSRPHYGVMEGGQLIWTPKRTAATAFKWLSIVRLRQSLTGGNVLMELV